MKTYIYLLKLNQRLYDDAAWTDIDNEKVNAHFERLKADFESGKVLHIGRTVDPKYEGFGLVVYCAENDEVAHQYMMEDPAVVGGQMTATFQPYHMVFPQK